MSLDPVELILEVEDHFKISLPDEDLSECRTVGNFVNLVISHSTRRDSDVCLTSRGFYRFRSALLGVLSLDRSGIRPSSRIEDLIPKKERRLVWRRLKQAGLDLPGLELSRFGFYLTACVVLLPFLWLRVRMGSWWPLVGVVPAVYCAYLLTRPLAVCAPSSFKTAGGAALCLAAKQPGPVVLSQAEVASRVRWIIADYLAISVEDVTMDTKWADLL